MFAKSPLHLFFSKSGYIFRYSLPKDVRSKFKRHEIKIALRTFAFPDARNYSRLISSLVQSTIEKIRRGQPVTILTNEQIMKVVKEYFLVSLGADETTRFLPGCQDIDTDHIEATYEESKESLANCEYWAVLSEAQIWVPYVLKECSIEESDINLNDISVRKLCRELLKAKIKYAEIAMKRCKGDYSGEYHFLDQIPGSTVNSSFDARPAAIDSTPVSKPDEGHGRSLGEIIDFYSDECRRAKKWNERTESEMLTTFDLLKRILGDVPIKRITREQIAGFKATLMKLPPNINKVRAYRNKSIPEIIEYVSKHDHPLLSMVTVDKIMGRVTALFCYADTHGYIQSNPASGIIVEVTKNARTVVAPFTDQELHHMFNSDIVINDRFRHPYQFWILALAPFTGCRLDEMCQLYLDDIRQEDGIWVLDINDDAPDKNLKTESIRRLIPLHPFLIDNLQFPAFVEKLRSRCEKRLFPELKREPNGGYGRAMTRWFPVFREKAGVPQFDAKAQKKVFHSFRHTFDTRLKHKYVKTTMIDELMGHAVEKLSMGTYGAQYPILQKLEDGVLKLEYDLAMFERMKTARFCSTP